MTTSRTAGRTPRLLLVGATMILAVGVAFSVRAVAATGSGTSATAANLVAAAQLAGTPVDVLSSASAPANAVAGTPTPVPTQRQWDTNVPGVINDPVLASQLDQALTGVDGHVGVAVQDMGSGRGAVLDGDLELQSASLFKMPILYTVFQLGLDMSEELTITQGALAYDSGTMELGPGETLSIAELLERMVTLSDNTSAIMLSDRVGAPDVVANIDALGLTNTHYTEDRQTTSALDMLRLTELIADGKAVSPAASADMLHLLLRQRVNDRLPRLLPDDVQVAHKTGNLPGVVNDVGVLYGPNSTVAVAALVSDTTDETAAATAIAQIGLAANAYFESLPVVDGRPTIPAAPSRPIPPVWREPHPPTATPRPAAVVERSVETTPRPTTVETPPTAGTPQGGASPTAVSTAAATPPATAKPTSPPTAAPTATHAPAAPTAAPTAPPPAATPTPAPPAQQATKPPTAPPGQPTAARGAAPAPGATVTPVRH